ncbi:MAG: hypothetical protein GY866_39020 [Proteobacteria bacterium]|nr:hypothetical protein [Pseudomonadota bacterium]
MIVGFLLVVFGLTSCAGTATKAPDEKKAELLKETAALLEETGALLADASPKDIFPGEYLFKKNEPIKPFTLSMGFINAKNQAKERFYNGLAQELIKEFSSSDQNVSPEIKKVLISISKKVASKMKVVMCVQKGKFNPEDKDQLETWGKCQPGRSDPEKAAGIIVVMKIDRKIRDAQFSKFLKNIEASAENGYPIAKALLSPMRNYHKSLTE